MAVGYKSSDSANLGAGPAAACAGVPVNRGHTRSLLTKHERFLDNRASVLRFQRCSSLSAWNVCACHGSSENANERSATLAPDALSAIANCRSCSNSRCAWPMTKAYGSFARSVPGQLRASGFSVDRGNAQAFEDRTRLEARNSEQFRLPTAARTAISQSRASGSAGRSARYCAYKTSVERVVVNREHRKLTLVLGKRG